MARIAIYALTSVLLIGAGGWLWWSRQPPPAPAVAVAPPVPPPAPTPVPAPAVNPSFDVVRVAPDGRTVVAGRAAPGAEVTVKSGEDTVGGVKADARGEWVLLPDRPLAPGTRELTLSASNDGGPAKDGAASVVVVVPEKAAEGTSLAALLPGDAAGGTRVLQAPAPEGDVAAAKGLAIDAVDFDAKGVIRPSGKAMPGAEVRLYLDNRLLGSVRADEQGHWSLPPSEPVGTGQHMLRADQLAADGKIAARIEAPFNRAGPALPATAKPGTLMVQPGNSLWRLARRTYGAGDRYTVIYQANRNLIRDPNKIYPGQLLVTPAAQR